MQKFFLLILFFTFSISLINAQLLQQNITVKGQVLNAADNKTISNVSIININTVKGAVTNKDGDFEIDAKVNDTLYFSFIGFKPLKTRVTNDWVNYGNVKVKLTEVGIALQEVVVSSHGLTGFLEIDAKNIPVYNNQNRYAIAGGGAGYEGGNDVAGSINRTLESVLNPVSVVFNLFTKKNVQLRRLRKMKKDEEIRNLLVDKFDRETLTTLLEVEKVDIDEILGHCNYSKEFIKKANDLQILDAISECYEEFKVLNRKK